MASKTQAIVLRTVKYSDKASIATLYTREHGTVSYMLYGLNSKRSRTRSSCFLPLSIIDVTASMYPNRDIQQMKEARVAVPLTDLYCDPIKTSIAMFIAELLSSCLRNGETESPLYTFIHDAILKLEKIEENTADFHLVFMAKLSDYLGFNPYDDENDTCYFDLMNGVFVSRPPMHEHFLDQEMTKVFRSLLEVDFDELEALTISRTTRNKLLDALLDYYKLHMPGFKGLKSLDVLRDLFS